LIEGVDVIEGPFTPIPADLFGQDLQDPYPLTIYDLLLTIVIDYFLLTIDYFFAFFVLFRSIIRINLRLSAVKENDY